MLINEDKAIRLEIKKRGFGRNLYEEAGSVFILLQNRVTRGNVVIKKNLTNVLVSPA